MSLHSIYSHFDRLFSIEKSIKRCIEHGGLKIVIFDDFFIFYEKITCKNNVLNVFRTHGLINFLLSVKIH